MMKTELHETPDGEVEGEAVGTPRERITAFLKAYFGAHDGSTMCRTSLGFDPRDNNPLIAIEIVRMEGAAEISTDTHVMTSVEALILAKALRELASHLEKGATASIKGVEDGGHSVPPDAGESIQ